MSKTACSGDVCSDLKLKLVIEFLLNEFCRIDRICRIENIFVHKMCSRTGYLLCNKPACYHSASKTHVKDSIFKLSGHFMHELFIRFTEFAEFREFLFHLGKTPMIDIC